MSIFIYFHYARVMISISIATWSREAKCRGVIKSNVAFVQVHIGVSVMLTPDMYKTTGEC